MMSSTNVLSISHFIPYTEHFNKIFYQPFTF